MDKTLGISTVITPANIDLLVDDMKRGLVADIERASAEEIRNIESSAASQVLAAISAKNDAEARANQAGQELLDAHGEDARVVGQLLGEVNTYLRRVRRGIVSIGAIVLLAFAFGPIIAEVIEGWKKFIPLAFVAAFTFFHTRLLLLDRPTGLDKFLAILGQKRLEALASKRALSAKLARFDYRLESDRFVFSEKAPTLPPDGHGDLLARIKGTTHGQS